MRSDPSPRPVILVIDDDSIHTALRLVLEEDYEVISAFDGDEGLASRESWLLGLQRSGS